MVRVEEGKLAAVLLLVAPLLDLDRPAPKLHCDGALGDGDPALPGETLEIDVVSMD